MQNVQQTSGSFIRFETRPPPLFRVWAFEHPARDGGTSDARVDRAIATWIRCVVLWRLRSAIWIV